MHDAAASTTGQAVYLSAV